MKTLLLFGLMVGGFLVIRLQDQRLGIKSLRLWKYVGRVELAL
jgi:hypothetical protein